MTKSQIEEQRVRFEEWFKSGFWEDLHKFDKEAFFDVWLAAKQDVDTRSGLVQSYCAYCGTESYEHLPNCKGARG